MYRRRITALLLSLLLLFSVSACGAGRNGYTVASAGLDARTLSVCVREGDPLGDVLYAALQVRVADGTASGLSHKWFGKDLLTLKGRADALAGVEYAPERVLLVGYDPSAMPFSGTDGGEQAQGFDIELAESVCELLGWELRALPIDADSAAIELASGEVDCVWGGISRIASGVQGFSYMETEYVFVSMQAAPVRRVKALRGKSVCYPQFAQYAADALALDGTAETAAKLQDTETCFAALKAGRCDAVLTDDVSAAYFFG